LVRIKIFIIVSDEKYELPFFQTSFFFFNLIYNLSFREKEMIITNAYKDIELIVIVISDDRVSINNKKKWIFHVVF